MDKQGGYSYDMRVKTNTGNRGAFRQSIEGPLGDSRPPVVAFSTCTCSLGECSSSTSDEIVVSGEGCGLTGPRERKSQLK